MRALFAVLVGAAFAAPVLAADPVYLPPPRVFEERAPQVIVIVVQVPQQVPQPVAAQRVQFAAPQTFYAPTLPSYPPTVTLERAPVQFVQPQTYYTPAPARAVVGTAPFPQGVTTLGTVAPGVEQRRRQLSVSIGTERTRTLAPAAVLPGATNGCANGNCPTLRRFP